MTRYGPCGDLRYAIAVYLLGAIEPADRAAVVSHLSSCPRCAAELAGLAGLPGLLRKVPPAEAEPLADEPAG